MARLLDWLRWRRTGSRELTEEIRTHLAMEAERLQQDEGLPPDASLAEARRRFGNVPLALEDSASVWGFPRLESWGRDMRFGLRLLARNRLFTTIAVASLGLGLGAGIAGFSLLHTLLAQSLPVRAPRELRLLHWVASGQEDLLPDSVNGWLDLDDGGKRSSTSFSYASYAYLRDRQRSFSDMVAFAEIPRLLVRLGPESDTGSGQYVSGNYFQTLGVDTVIGRALGRGDDRPDAEAVTVLSYEAWQRRFAGSPSVVGARLVLNRVPVVVVGVSPRGFHGCLQVGQQPEFTVPLSLQARLTPEDGDGLRDKSYWWLQIIGRTRTGTAAEQADRELARLFDQQVAAGVAQVGRKVAIPRLRTSPGHQGLMERRRELRAPLWFVAALVGLVLVVAVANVAGLLLARATAREREMALRLAIGASRRRLARQVLTETVVLGLLGGGVGVVLATWFVPMLLSAAQPRAADPVVVPLELNGELIAFGLGLSVVAGLALGLVTLLGGSRLEVSAVAREKATSLAAGRARIRLGKALVVGQMGLSLVLVVLSGLFVETARNLQQVRTGINPDRLLQFRVEPGLQGYEGERRQQLLLAILEHVRRVPGVRSAGFSRHALFTGSSAISTIVLPGGAKPAASSTPAFGGTPVAWIHAIGGDFLETLGVPLVAGRRLDERDASSGAQVALVNRTFARNFFGRENPVGRTIGTEKGGPSFEIVGVVGDARYAELRQEPPPTLYLPFTRRLATFGTASFYVRAERAPQLLADPIRRAVREQAPGLPVLGLSSLDETIRAATAPERRLAMASTFFGVLAVLLGCIGLYGIMAYAVSRRTAEMGVRLALGASPGRLVMDLLRESAVVVAAGLAAGIACALAFGGLVRAHLFGVPPADPFTFVVSAALVAGVALAAGFVPARRASKLDPLTALRSE